MDAIKERMKQQDLRKNRTFWNKERVTLVKKKNGRVTTVTLASRTRVSNLEMETEIAVWIVAETIVVTVTEIAV